MMDLQKAWDEDPNNSFRLDFFTTISFDREFSRAIVKDIPLMPLVFGIMSVLCCLFFADRDIVKSRSLLGFGALTTILLGMMFGYGLMFLIGVPFTTLTQILPFVPRKKREKGFDSKQRTDRQTLADFLKDKSNEKTNRKMCLLDVKLKLCGCCNFLIRQ